MTDLGYAMDWQQKLAALQAFAPCTLHMRKPGDWFASLERVEIADDAGLLRSTSGNGPSPEAAVIAVWGSATNLPNGHYLVRHAYGSERQAVRWNGFMWEPVVEPTAEARAGA